MQQPQPHYRLKADMVLRGLSLQEVARAAGVPYSRASEILNGSRVDPIRLTKLRAVIRRAKVMAGATA